VEIRDLEGKPIRKLDLPGLGTVDELEGEPDHDELFYGFVNFTEPLENLPDQRHNPAQQLWAKLEVQSNPSPYLVEQKILRVEGRHPGPDVYRAPQGHPARWGTPFLIYGYGGFGISETPSFWAGAYPWLEAGGGFALVNLRGGGEFGEQWHQDGMLLKKQNVFDDCIAAAEYLIREGYTKPERLAVRGGSNGGLLAGAVLTQRPISFARLSARDRCSI